MLIDAAYMKDVIKMVDYVEGFLIPIVMTDECRTN